MTGCGGVVGGGVVGGNVVLLGGWCGWVVVVGGSPTHLQCKQQK